MFKDPVPFLIGLAFLFLGWILYAAIVGNWNPLKIIEGADGRPSTSKLQFWLWTIVALYSYVALYAARVLDAHSTAALGSIPASLMIAMGLSVTTATAAKTITSTYVQSGKVAKDAAPRGTSLFSSLLQDDDGSPDLSKLQLLAWTAVAIGIYLIAVGYKIGSMHLTGKPEDLPDIDAALMVLMGLGQGAYIGKKLVTTSTPRLTGLSPNTGAPGTAIQISGLAFGADGAGDQVTYDGTPIDSSLVQSWSDTKVIFKIPATAPGGKPWPGTGQQVSIGMISNGQDSANTLPLAVT
ncbi:MAG TPA: IPT/TIG domain-containing protein [Blastocatellia bacterium]|nr:IPT/TIG domain-containing protein [Blastocatellia bacterium]